MEKKITLPEDVRDYLERLDYDKSATQLLLMDAAARGLSDSPAFERWEKKFAEAFSAFEIAKNEITEKYVRPLSEGKDSTWEVQYDTGILTIRVQGGDAS